jgi:transcriptional regulator with XRE-family HTH domain
MRKKGKAQTIDTVIGNNIKAVRVMGGLSQQALAKGLGISFQQIQKYEKGQNRVSAGTLLKIADFMSVSPMSLFNEVTIQTGEETSSPMIFNQEILDLIHTFNKIKDERVRTSIKNFLRAMSAGKQDERT